MMDLRQLNFHHLYYFWRVGREGNLTRTAQALHLSQSALSAQIRQLEERLGLPLFLREGKRLVLTDAGHLVMSYANEIFDLGRELLSQLEGSHHGRPRLRVGSVSTLSRNFLENWLKPLLAEPEVHWVIESGWLGGLLERLYRFQLDVVFATQAVPADPERVFHCHLLAVQPVVVVGHAELWHGRKLRIPEDLDGLEMAVPGARHALRSQFDALCDAAGVHPKIRAEIDDMAMLRLIARDSAWLSLLPEVVVQDELRAGVLTVVGQHSSLQERFYAITLPHRRRSELLGRLLTATGGK